MPNQPLQSPSNRAVWSGTGERGKEREKSGEKENRRDREEERGIENMPHLEKAKACGVSRKERDR